MKHRLWGKLKRRAKEKYRIFPVKGYNNLYEIGFLDGDHYESYNPCPTYRSLEDAIRRVEWMRDEYFEKICCEVLYKRRCKKLEDL